MKLTHEETTRALMAPHVPALLSCLGRALGGAGAATGQRNGAGPAPAAKEGQELLEAEVRAEVGQFLQWLASQVPPQQLASATAALPEGERAVLAGAGLAMS